MLLFLGAGASKSFGIPDTKGFLSEFEPRIGNSEIYGKLKSSIPAALLDTEVLMTVLHDLSKPKEELLDSIAPHTTRFLLQQGAEMARYIESEDVKVMCHDMLREVKRTIRTRCLAQVRNEKTQIVASYDAFWANLEIAKGIRAGDKSAVMLPALSLFTTNYDTCVETYFRVRQVTYSRGIVERFGEYVYDVGRFLRQEQRSDIELIKLHGSIDFFVKNGQIRFLPGAGAMDTSAITYLGDEYGPEFMVYPVESSTSVDLMKSPLIEQLYVFRERLAQNRTWIVIGSTFRDSSLASIMSDVLMQRAEGDYPTVLHINPEAKRINTYLENKGHALLASLIRPIEYRFVEDSLWATLRGIPLR